MSLTKLHARDIQRIDRVVRTVEGAPIVHPNETRKRRMMMATTPFLLAKITGYAEGNKAYKGRFVNPDGSDRPGQTEDTAFYIARGVPSTEDDVRHYWPRCYHKDEPDLMVAVFSMIIEIDGENTARWFILPVFGMWCEAEAMPGAVPRLPKLAPPGGELPPSGVTPLQRPPSPIQGPDPEPDDPAEFEAWLNRQRDGRPCGGCGDG